MDLGISKVINEGNGNAIIYTALLGAMIANAVPTPFDAIYFNNVNKLERKYDAGEISAEKLEWNVAGQYYLWTAGWYLALFTGVYAFGGKYKKNARVILALIAGGLVVGAVQRNIQFNKEVEKKKQTK